MTEEQDRIEAEAALILPAAPEWATAWPEVAEAWTEANLLRQQTQIAHDAFIEAYLKALQEWRQ